MKKLKVLFALAAAFVLGCGTENEHEPVSSQVQAFTSIPQMGLVPFPVQVDPTTLEPKKGPDGVSLMSAWNASIPDLLAADAYAECATTGWDYLQYTDLGIATKRFEDNYLESLRSNMAAVPCPGTTPAPTTPETIWLDRRKRAVCNVDTQSLTARANPLSTSRDMSGYNTFTPAASSYWGVTATTTPIRDAIFRRASRMLGYADVNLCMALKLRTQLENPQSLFLSLEDQKSLYEIIMKRANQAVTEFGLIGKVATSTDPFVATGLTSESQYLIGLRKWLDASPRSRIVQDFATSVKLHGAALIDIASLLRREASARSVRKPANTIAAADFGSLSARQLLLEYLSTGDATTYYNAASWWDADLYKNVAIKDPLVTVLLGLAQQNNSTYTNADGLLFYTELELRVKECPSCDRGDVVASIPQVTSGVPDRSRFQELRLWQKHRIHPDHAENLAAAMGNWKRNLNVFGTHGGDWFDAGFTLGDKAPFLAYTSPWSRPGLPKNVLFGASPESQAFVAPGTNGPSMTGYYATPRVGGAPTLAFAREALFDLASKFATGADAATISSALAEITRLVGTRTVMLRRQKLPTTDDALHVAHVLTGTTDPFNRLIQFDPSPAWKFEGFKAALIDPGSTSLVGSFSGVNRNFFDNIARVTPTVAAASASGPAKGLEVRTFNFTSSAGAPVHVALTQSALGEQQYAYVGPVGIRNGTPTGPFLGPPMTAVASDGEIGNIVARTFARSSADRSKPAYDAFDFPTNWMPPSDASLVGGSPGQDSYTYYLAAAENAASEASTAVQQSIDSLLQQASDQVSVFQAEEQAKQIAALETRSLCGPASSCDVPTNWTLFYVNGADCNTRCVQALAPSQKVLGYVRLAQVVIDQPDDSERDFREYDGGEMQRVLLRQLAAKKGVNAALNVTMSLARAHSKNVTAAFDAKAAARAEFNSAQADADAAIAGLNQQNADIAAEIAALMTQVAEINSELDGARQEQAVQCDDQAFTDSFEAGFSVPKRDDLDYTASYGVPRPSIRYKKDDYTFSAGPMIHQAQSCDRAWRELKRREALIEPLQTSLQAKYDALINKRTDLAQAQRDAIAKRRKAADAALQAAESAAVAAIENSWTQVMSQVVQVQSAMVEVRASSADLASVQLRTQTAISRGNLEAELAAVANSTRWGLSRNYRSYDLWRARAMLENARRLAVAARKAIESRFVINLSEIDAAQTFVEAPSTWADNVYQTDLSPPSSVGRTAAPKDGNGVYANKLSDYVQNLRLFVQGYTISYPTSVAAPDTEVITIPGLDRHVTLAADGGDVLSGDSQGWRFHCSATDTWVPHPGIGEKPLVSTLDTACGGERPTQARFQFTLDPWARINGDIVEEPHKLRHNVRWRQLAVNVVGTGIRNCQVSNNPEQCYSEQFLRYDFAHAGPSWATNHSQSWRLLQTPTAFIEGAKALTVEEWLDPIHQSWNQPFVGNVARGEFFGRPVSGAYDLVLDLPSDVVFSRIEQVQILTENDYWVVQR